MWCINGTEDDSERNQHPENKSAKDEKECPFLRLGSENIFVSRDHLNFKSRSKNVDPYGVPLAPCYVSIFSPEKGKGSPLCVSANRKKKKKITCFETFRGHRKLREKEPTKMN